MPSPNKLYEVKLEYVNSLKKDTLIIELSPFTDPVDNKEYIDQIFLINSMDEKKGSLSQCYWPFNRSLEYLSAKWPQALIRELNCPERGEVVQSFCTCFGANNSQNNA